MAKGTVFQEIRPWAGFKTDDFDKEKIEGGYRKMTPLGDKLLYLDLATDIPGADAHRRVFVERCKPCANPHDRGDMPKYLPDGLTEYVLNKFTKKSPPYHVTQADVSAPLQRLEVERMTGMATNRSVVGVESSR